MMMTQLELKMRVLLSDNVFLKKLKKELYLLQEYQITITYYLIKDSSLKYN
jgi:hypothetical protein